MIFLKKHLGKKIPKIKEFVTEYSFLKHFFFHKIGSDGPHLLGGEGGGGVTI